MLVNQGAGGDDGAVADFHASEDGGIGADHNVTADGDFAGGPFMDEEFMSEDRAVVANDCIVAYGN